MMGRYYKQFHFIFFCLVVSTIAWRTPGMGEPGRLLSMGLHSQTRLKRLSSSSSSSRHYVEKAMAPHSNTLAWKIPWTEEPGRLQSMGLLESDTTERLHFHFSLSCIGEGNGNPLQCSCLENPRDGGAWWAAVYRVAQSDTTEAT